MRRNEDFILFDYDVCFKDNCGHVALVKWFEFQYYFQFSFQVLKLGCMLFRNGQARNEGLQECLWSFVPRIESVRIKSLLKCCCLESCLESAFMFACQHQNKESQRLENFWNYMLYSPSALILLGEYICFCAICLSDTSYSPSLLAYSPSSLLQEEFFFVLVIVHVPFIHSLCTTTATCATTNFPWSFRAINHTRRMTPMPWMSCSHG